MCQLLDHRQYKATAIVATTCPAAIGSIRACYERDIEVGTELSICAVNLEPPAAWCGPKLLEPQHSNLFKGESTGRYKQRQ
jgi:DNA-binding LacI/PurR family transcriptional regulator